MENAVFLNQRFDLVERVHHGCMMFAAKLTTYLRIAVSREAFAKIHRNLAGDCDRPRVVFGMAVP